MNRKAIQLFLLFFLLLSSAALATETAEISSPSPAPSLPSESLPPKAVDPWVLPLEALEIDWEAFKEGVAVDAFKEGKPAVPPKRTLGSVGEDLYHVSGKNVSQYCVLVPVSPEDASSSSPSPAFFTGRNQGKIACVPEKVEGVQFVKAKVRLWENDNWEKGENNPTLLIPVKILVPYVAPEPVSTEDTKINNASSAPPSTTTSPDVDLLENVKLLEKQNKTLTDNNASLRKQVKVLFCIGFFGFIAFLVYFIVIKNVKKRKKA